MKKVGEHVTIDFRCKRSTLWLHNKVIYKIAKKAKIEF